MRLAPNLRTQTSGSQWRWPNEDSVEAKYFHSAPVESMSMYLRIQHTGVDVWQGKPAIVLSWSTNSSIYHSGLLLWPARPCWNKHVVRNVINLCSAESHLVKLLSCVSNATTRKLIIIVIIVMASPWDSISYITLHWPWVSRIKGGTVNHPITETST